MARLYFRYLSCDYHQTVQNLILFAKLQLFIINRLCFNDFICGVFKKLSHDSSEPWLSGFITVFDFIRSLSSCER